MTKYTKRGPTDPADCYSACLGMHICFWIGRTYQAIAAVRLHIMESEDLLQRLDTLAGVLYSTGTNVVRNLQSLEVALQARQDEVRLNSQCRT